MSNTAPRPQEIRQRLISLAAAVDTLIDIVRTERPEASYYWNGNYRQIVDDLDDLRGQVMDSARMVARPGQNHQLWDKADYFNREWRQSVRGEQRLDEMRGRLFLYFDTSPDLINRTHTALLAVERALADTVPRVLLYTVNTNTALDL
jgi:hypothetical protein